MRQKINPDSLSSEGFAKLLTLAKALSSTRWFHFRTRNKIYNQLRKLK